MADTFATLADAWDKPYTSVEAADLGTTDHTFTNTTRAVYVNATGNVKLDTADGQTVTLTSLPVGEFRIRATKVYKVGTTATVVGMW